MREGGNTPSLSLCPARAHPMRAEFSALKHYSIFLSARALGKLHKKNPENIFIFVHFANRQIACKVV